MQKMSVLQGVLQKRVAGSVSVKNFWMGSQVMLPATHTEHEHTRALCMGRGNEGQSSGHSCRSKPVHVTVEYAFCRANVPQYCKSQLQDLVRIPRVIQFAVQFYDAINSHSPKWLAAL